MITVYIHFQYEIYQNTVDKALRREASSDIGKQSIVSINNPVYLSRYGCSGSTAACAGLRELTRCRHSPEYNMEGAIWDGEDSSQPRTSDKQQTCQGIRGISEVENVPNRLPVPSIGRKRDGVCVVRRQPCLPKPLGAGCWEEAEPDPEAHPCAYHP